MGDERLYFRLSLLFESRYNQLSRAPVGDEFCVIAQTTTQASRHYVREELVFTDRVTSERIFRVIYQNRDKRRHDVFLRTTPIHLPITECREHFLTFYRTADVSIVSE